MTPDLHERLVARQSTAELERKAKKAWRRAIWTQEDIDFAERRGHEIWRSLHRNCGNVYEIQGEREPCR